MPWNVVWVAPGESKRDEFGRQPEKHAVLNPLTLHVDNGNNVAMKQTGPAKKVQRVQIGARMEKTLVKVLKALAEYLDLSLGDLLEGVSLHALEGKSAFSPKTLGHVKKLRAIYGLDLNARDSHRLVEEDHADE